LVSYLLTVTFDIPYNVHLFMFGFGAIDRPNPFMKVFIFCLFNLII
jgi:hypothetical protein